MMADMKNSDPGAAGADADADDDAGAEGEARHAEEVDSEDDAPPPLEEAAP